MIRALKLHCSELALGGSIFIFMFGIPTTDLNPIYNVHTLGIRKAEMATPSHLAYKLGASTRRAIALTLLNGISHFYEC